MKPSTSVLSDGQQYLVKIDTDGEVETSSGTAKTRLKGELVLRLHGDHPQAIGVSAPRFVLAAGSLPAAKGPTGVVSVIARRGSGMIEVSRDAAMLVLELDVQLNYESLDPMPIA